MPTYACSTAAGQLTQSQREEIMKRITDVHAEVTGAPRYLVQVVFYDLQPHAHFIGGEAASAGQIWIRADIRSGRTDEQKKQIMERILKAVTEATKVPPEDIWVYISDIPASSVAEYGRVLPAPGGEATWLASFPDALKARMHKLA